MDTFTTRASDALYDSLCPGRPAAQHGIPEPPPSADAAEGRKMHEAVAKGDPSGLSIEQTNTYDACLKITDKLLKQFFGDKADEAKLTAIREKGFVMNIGDWKHGGHPDVIFRLGTRALLPDYKTLRGEHDDALLNKQLRHYVALFSSNTLLLDQIGVAIVQPLVTWSPQLCVYTTHDIKSSVREVIQQVTANHDPNAPRVPGEVQCKFCRAKTKCHEYQQWAGATLPATTSLIDVPMEQWSAEQRAQFCDKFDVAQKWLNEAWNFCYRGLLKDSQFVPGYQLNPGNNMKTAQTHCLRTDNPQELFARFEQLGGKLEDFMKAVGVINAQFKEIVAKQTGLKGRDLETKIGELLDGLVETKQNAPTMKKVKEKGTK